MKMAYIQDSTQTFTITLSALLQGKGIIALIEVVNETANVSYVWEDIYGDGVGVWTPSMPSAVEGDSILIGVSVLNDGATTDIIYATFVSSVTPTGALTQEASVVVSDYLHARWNFIMPPNNVNITINAGHVE